jgi:hypothetical protein
VKGIATALLVALVIVAIVFGINAVQERRRGAYVHPTTEQFICWDTTEQYSHPVTLTFYYPEKNAAVEYDGTPVPFGILTPQSGVITADDNVEVRWQFPSGWFRLNRATLQLIGGITEGTKTEMPPYKCNPA